MNHEEKAKALLPCAALAAKDEELVRRDDEIAELVNKLAEASKEAHIYRDERDGLQSSYLNLQAEFAQLRAQLAEVIEAQEIRAKSIRQLATENEQLRAERDELNEEIERCCKELGDAGILITQGPRDGITKLINERDAAIGKPYTNIVGREMLRDEYVRGLERAKEIIATYSRYSAYEPLCDAIQVEIDKAGK